MTHSFQASLSSEAHKKTTAKLTIQEMISRIKSYDVSFWLRYLQAEEYAESILEKTRWIEYSTRAVMKEFHDFMNWTKIELSVYRIPIGKEVFLQQSVNLKNIIESIERWVFDFDDKLQTIKTLLSRAKNVWRMDSNTDISSESEIWESIDFEKIIQIKAMIPRERLLYKDDDNYMQVLDDVYLYYTQFWRMTEIIGDAYNDIQVLLEKRGTWEIYDFFCDWLVCFNKQNPEKFITVCGKRIDFINSSSEDRQAIILLYTLSKKPWEKLESFKTYYEEYRDLFWMQRTRITPETIRKYYVIRLNNFFEKHKIPYICQKDTTWIFLNKIAKPLLSPP